MRSSTIAQSFEVLIHPTNGWKALLADEVQKDYFIELSKKLDGTSFAPNHYLTFRALRLTPYQDLKVVILGQDPYPGLGMADGLAFSSFPFCSTPPSLKNIFKEIELEYGAQPKFPDLSFWAKQGVLLLNRILSVEEGGNPLSHKNIGWEKFTKKIVELACQKQNVIFLLWGAEAQKLLPLIKDTKNRYLLAPHPSPLSFHKGFLGCNHFKLVNRYLQETGRTEINWVGK